MTAKPKPAGKKAAPKKAAKPATAKSAAELREKAKRKLDEAFQWPVPSRADVMKAIRAAEAAREAEVVERIIEDIKPHVILDVRYPNLRLIDEDDALTAPNLPALALAAEDAAARGEKPVLNWRFGSRSQGWHPHAEETKMGNGLVREDANGWRYWCDHRNSPRFKSMLAAQLFAESLLRLATAPLHREPAWREKAVEFAAKVLDGCESWEYGHGQNDLWARSHAAGLTYFDSEKDQVQLTPAGAALLAATADAKREEKPDA